MARVYAGGRNDSGVSINANNLVNLPNLQAMMNEPKATRQPGRWQLWDAIVSVGDADVVAGEVEAADAGAGTGTGIRACGWVWGRFGVAVPQPMAGGQEGSKGSVGVTGFPVGVDGQTSAPALSLAASASTGVKSSAAVSSHWNRGCGKTGQGATERMTGKDEGEKGVFEADAAQGGEKGGKEGGQSRLEAGVDLNAELDRYGYEGEAYIWVLYIRGGAKGKERKQGSCSLFVYYQ